MNAGGGDAPIRAFMSNIHMKTWAMAEVKGQMTRLLPGRDYELDPATANAFIEDGRGYPIDQPKLENKNLGRVKAVKNGSKTRHRAKR